MGNFNREIRVKPEDGRKGRAFVAVAKHVKDGEIGGDRLDAVLHTVEAFGNISEYYATNRYSGPCMMYEFSQKYPELAKETYRKYVGHLRNGNVSEISAFGFRFSDGRFLDIMGVPYVVTEDEEER